MLRRAMSARADIGAGRRFEFGANWRRFLQVLNEERIASAQSSLVEMLQTDSLAGQRFLDAGSGSGLFSLVARLLGAEVVSFDLDPESVECTLEVKRRHRPHDSAWTVHEGSVLDRSFLSTLGTFDIVYSWGVLHHTGDLFTALGNVAEPVRPSGRLFISVYNDQGAATRRWKWVKRRYNSSGRLGKAALLVGSAARLGTPAVARRAFRARQERGARTQSMAWWTDLVDWVGGWPFEAANPEVIFDFYRERGFALHRLRTCGGGLGCNEFVFVKSPST
jgi:2-polyprenyl-6-hydroxyphenyl methylase/3-demethylubiquinone-9 3-methyltransferase